MCAICFLPSLLHVHLIRTRAPGKVLDVVNLLSLITSKSGLRLVSPPDWTHLGSCGAPGVGPLMWDRPALGSYPGQIRAC